MTRMGRGGQLNPNSETEEQEGTEITETEADKQLKRGQFVSFLHLFQPVPPPFPLLPPVKSLGSSGKIGRV